MIDWNKEIDKMLELENDSNFIELSQLIIGVSLNCENQNIAEKLCKKYSQSTNELVRGNAILGFW